MKIGIEKSDSQVKLHPEGDIDANSSIDLDATIGQMLEGGQKKIYVDFSKVSYISSAGLGVFIHYLDELAEKEGKFVLTNVSETVRDVFAILGLDQIQPETLVILGPGEEEGSE